MTKDKKDKPQKEEKQEKDKKPAPKDNISKTKHSITINGQELKYTVMAGTMVLKEEDAEEGHKPKATVFFIAYTLDGVKDSAKRPITFSFNGGPGSSSVWLHMGLLGPKRVLMEEEGHPTPPPYKLVDNEYSLLDKSDLVFIDPVSTGYSRSLPGEKAEQFHDIKKDIESVGEFIRLYTTRHKRWASPKFVIGESYGTTRAAGLSGHLQQRLGMYLNGIMLVSSILNFQTARFTPGNDLPPNLFLPTYTATAWYHKKLAPDLQKDLRKTLEEVEAFAMNEYPIILMKGNTLTEDEREEAVKKLARYTGLSDEYIQQTNLRVNIHRFVKELRRDEGLTVGRLDSRFTGKDRDDAGEMYEFDPSYAVIQGPYTATFNQYVREHLQYESDLPYEIIAPISLNWKYNEFANQFVNVAETLRQAMNVNPNLKVLIANGYFDFATPYFATEYTVKHMELDAERLKDINLTYYESGHMMYIQMASLKQLKKDLDAFMESAI